VCSLPPKKCTIYIYENLSSFYNILHLTDRNQHRCGCHSQQTNYDYDDAHSSVRYSPWPLTPIRLLNFVWQLNDVEFRWVFCDGMWKVGSVGWVVRFVVWLGGAMGVAVAYLLHGTFITSLPVRKWVGGSVVQRLGGAAWQININRTKMVLRTHCPGGYGGMWLRRTDAVLRFSHVTLVAQRKWNYKMGNIAYEDLKQHLLSA